MTIGDLRQKFRQSKDYTYDMLIRDLIEHTYELEKILGEAETPKEWTPDLRFGGLKVGLVAPTARGSYTKVGKLVTLFGEILLSAKGSSVGSAQIYGMPYPCSATRPMIGTISYYTNMTLTAAHTLGLIANGEGSGLVMTPRMQSATAAVALTDAQFTNTSRIFFGGSYITA